MSYGRHFTLEDGTPATVSVWELREDEEDEPLYTRAVPETLFHASKEGWVDMVMAALPRARPDRLYWSRDGEPCERVIL